MFGNKKPKAEPTKLKVQVETYNKGQSGQFFGLVRLEKSGDGKRVERYPLHSAPNWKTSKGAENYAKKNGYELVIASDKSKNSTEQKPKQTQPLKMADGEKIPKGADGALISKDARGEGHIIMITSNHSLIDEKKTPAPKKTEVEAKRQLAGEVYDLKMLKYMSEQRKNLPSRESFIEAQLKPIKVGNFSSGPITIEELRAAKEELVKELKPAARNKSTEKPVAKSLEHKTVAPKKTAQSKPAAKREELPKAKSPKPAGKEHKSAPPKRTVKVLRRVEKQTGGFTAWDARAGKTFATEKEARDYAADIQKKTGVEIQVTRTDRQVTHTFKK